MSLRKRTVCRNRTGASDTRLTVAEFIDPHPDCNNGDCVLPWLRFPNSSKEQKAFWEPKPRKGEDSARADLGTGHDPSRKALKTVQPATAQRCVSVFSLVCATTKVRDVSGLLLFLSHPITEVTGFLSEAGSPSRRKNHEAPSSTRRHTRRSETFSNAAALRRQVSSRSAGYVSARASTACSQL